MPVVAGGSYTQMPAGFGIMDSSEASFYGLNTASLENADGNFEAPTVANLEAAEANITPCPTDDLSCPAGTYKINYTTTTSPNAYPMPDITYAMVPTAPLPASEAAALKNLLTNLVTFSHGGGSLALPSGYAPLSDSLYQTALTDISNDVVAEPPTPSTTVSTTTPTTPTTPTTTTASSGSSSGGSSGGSSSGDTGEGTSSFTGGSDDDLGALPLSSTSTPSSSTPSSSSDKGSVLAGTAAPTGFLLVSLDDAARYLLPAIVLLAIACLIGGPLLLFAPALRRRRRSQGGRS